TYKILDHATCAEALEIIDKYDIRALPVVTSNNQLQGLISIFDLGQYFIPSPTDPLKMSAINTNLDSITRALKAKPINLINPQQDEALFVRVGTMSESSFESSSIKANKPLHQTIIIVGSRTEIQKKSIESGIR